MKLSLITDDVALAVEAEQAGIDRIMIDLERDGKAERQAGRGLFLSTHRIESVARVKMALEKTPLVVRINPLSRRSRSEIDALAGSGADFIMLPYFSGLADVRMFLEIVRRRTRVILLVETRSAASQLRALADEPGVDEVHIGLNDLSISLGQDNLFEPIRAGMIDDMAAVLRDARLPFGFGGIARLSRQELPIDPERMLAEQVRLGASRGWLGRTFRGDLERSRAHGELAAEVLAIREAVRRWQSASPGALLENRAALHRQAAGVAASTAGDHRAPGVASLPIREPRTARTTSRAPAGSPPACGR
jgi:citrate lyase beta subunit